MHPMHLAGRTFQGRAKPWGNGGALNLAWRSRVDCSGRSWWPGRVCLGAYTYLRMRVERRGAAAGCEGPATTES